MQNWTLETIREGDASMSWMEEARFTWIPATSEAIKQMVGGRTIVLIADDDRKWFSQYITSFLNRAKPNRPMIPIVSIDSVYAHFNQISGDQSIEMLESMLDMSYNSQYFFWYIGKGDDRRADIAKRADSSYLWLLDEDAHNAFSLRSLDPQLDIKLLQLYQLFDMTLNAVLFGEIDELT
ncbi:MAG: HobA family DNA replication regulator [Campylobacterota bacterium]|nr:HobA family DNA replication regulator [Campylobacterota bacterium]